MSYSLSRLMSTATAAYAGLCFARPEHLGRAMKADKREQPGYDALAYVFGVRDLSVSTLAVLGRSERTVRTAMLIRIACDVGDGVVLAARADDEATSAKALAATLTWGALNTAALTIDTLRARKAAVRSRLVDTAEQAASVVVHRGDRA